MAMNIEEVKAFMEYYPWIEHCMYQHFDDDIIRKADPSREEESNALKSLWDYLTINSLTRLENINSRWWWIFFSVNGFDWDRRKKDDVKYINAWIAEIDHLDKQIQMDIVALSPIEPSLIVESKNSYHLYWFAEDWKLENWRKICRGLRNFFDSDPAVITPERILRIPWFDHCKDMNDRFPVTIAWWCQKKYTEMEMLLAFSNTETHEDRKEKKAKAEAYIRKYETENAEDNFWKRVWDIPADTMLEILSWSKHVNWDVITFKRNSDSQKQIHVNWKSTGCWIDSVGKIWTGKGSWWWPTWKQRVARYGSFDWPELYRLVTDKFPAFKPKVIQTQVPIVKEEKTVLPSDYLVWYDREFKTDYDSITPFTWWSEKLDKKFWRINHWMFMTTLWESWSWKTTFAFNQWIEIAKQFKVLFISLEMTPQRVIELRARKMAGITTSERDDKSFPTRKKEYMQKKIEDIKQVANLEIVTISRDSDKIDIDLIISSILEKYMNHDFFIIDNLWFIKAPDAKAAQWLSDYNEINYIIRRFKHFCSDNKKTVNLLHHFTKWTTKWRRERSLADALWSWKLENDIDIGVIISRNIFSPSEYADATEEDKAEVFIDFCKDRDNWMIGRELLYFLQWWYVDEFYWAKEEKKPISKEEDEDDSRKP